MRGCLTPENSKNDAMMVNVVLSVLCGSSLVDDAIPANRHVGKTGGSHITTNIIHHLNDKPSLNEEFQQKMQQYCKIGFPHQIPPSHGNDGTLQISRIMLGMWQVSSVSWGPYTSTGAIVKAMKQSFDQGFTTFDMADHYGSAELLFKSLNESIPAKEARPIGFTKWVPRPGPMSKEIVSAALQERSTRMGLAVIPCLQFHWWDYSDKRYLDALRWMYTLPSPNSPQRWITQLGLTNFDTKRCKEIFDSGVKISVNQVQYSLIDQRPKYGMEQFCAQSGMKMVTYGTLLGGYLSNQYIGAVPNPSTPSQKKYLQMITQWGGWPLFQELLLCLSNIADSQSVKAGKPKGHYTISNVAVRWTLDQPQVAAVIVGCRFSLSDHTEDNLRVFSMPGFSIEDLAAIESIQSRSNVDKLIKIIGDCGDEYR